MNAVGRRLAEFLGSLAAALIAAAGCSAGGDAAGTGGAAGSGATGGASATGGSATAGAPGTGGGPAADASGTAGGSETEGSTAAMGGISETAGGAGNGGAGGAAGAGGAGTAGAAPTGGTGGAFPVGDEFEGSALSPDWTVLRPDLADVVVSGGALSLTPHRGALWYQASQGVLVYKLVTGDFKVTATVHARRASNRDQTPNQFADVGGLMGRNPSGSSENYVLGVVGYAEMNQLAVEHKSTTNSRSTYGETAFTADAELRLCRTGATFTIYYRHPGDTGWPTSVAPITRADLPATLQVGMIAYTGVPSPDYVSMFDHITFEPVGAGCDR
ncbi:hypothetical protein [Sorangium atrum]|uniref:PE-PGRS family protein n=1 Tax=Sorangium atrum TaxID=2995308 RepID=A0ABT5BPN4_9BACT|nr:hypothetical protein [Sorangium aterium]MDC0676127.1 hypothetical protein [Sorangium aterium]